MSAVPAIARAVGALLLVLGLTASSPRRRAGGVGDGGGWMDGGGPDAGDCGSGDGGRCD